MFVIEKLVRDHEARNEAWERARDKWKAKNDYYSSRDYEDRYPRPGHWLKLVGKSLLIFVLVGAVVGTIISVSVGAEHHTKENKPKAATAQKQDTKNVQYKVGDTVQVVHGDFKDSVGVIVKLGDDDAIIKLTNSTYTHAMADSQQRSGGQDNGSLLSVNSLDNLVPYKEVK